jgi:hypothetical protein
MDEIEGKPVRDATVCAAILKKHDEITINIIRDMVDKGAPEEIATAFANEIKLMHKQTLIGRDFDERPAFMPETRWQNWLNAQKEKRSLRKKGPKKL